MAQLLFFLMSMLATVAISLLFVRKAVDWGFIDLPDSRKVHTLPTPRTGGLAMVLGGGIVFVLSLTLGYLPKPDLSWQTWLAGLGFVTIGALDDRFSFHPKQKFLIFLFLSVLAAWPWTLILRTQGVPWLPHAWAASPIFLIVAAVIITFWFMAVPNAVNIEDAINGYMGGFTFIILSLLAFRGLNTYIFLGALLGFLILNWPKAKHFMGDAGSFGCGFVLAETLLRGGALITPFMAIIVTLPISADVAMGIIRRRRLGMSLFEADRSTFPHHLLARFGGSHVKAALALWFISLGFVALWPFPILAIAYMAGYICLLVFLNAGHLFHRQSART